MREFAFANVPSSWLGRGWSRLGSRLRVTICTAAPAEPAELAKVALDARLPPTKIKKCMPPESNVQGEKSGLKNLRKT